MSDLHYCFKRINEALGEKGSRLSLVISDDGKVSMPRVMVEDIEEGSGVSTNRNMVASCCPFCGDVLDKNHAMESPTRPYSVQMSGGPK